MPENKKRPETPEDGINAKTEKEPKPKKADKLNIPKALLYLALGILIGALFSLKATEFLPTVLPSLMAIFIAFFFLIILLIVALPRIFNYLAKRYTGKNVDVEEAIEDIQAKTNHIADAIAVNAFAKADPEVQENIRKDIPTILHYLIFSRLRNTGLRLLMTVFIAIGGLMGTILLYNQNQLLQKQNEKIDNQILLDEASRRSSLNFLMANVLDKIDEELKEAERQGKARRLSPQLIGRIASLSQSFQPYRFMEDGKMVERPLSPERGNLLLALVNSSLDTSTMKIIFQKTVFRKAIFREANLSGANLSRVNLFEANLRGANLSRANLFEANLRGAMLSGAKLFEANLRGALLSGAKLRGANLYKADFSIFNEANYMSRGTLYEANLSGANLTEANLRGTYLRHVDFTGARLRRTDFTGADLTGADLTGADLLEADFYKIDSIFTDPFISEIFGSEQSRAILSNVDFSGVKNVTLEQLKEAFSLYNSRNLDPELEKRLKSEKPCLFTEEGCK